MKIQKYSYLPTGHSHAINFGFGLIFDSQRQCHIVSLFALNDNGGSPLCKYLPEVCVHILEHCGGSPKVKVSDCLWTYSAGHSSTTIQFSATDDGLLFHMQANNPVAFLRELQAGTNGEEGDFLWSAAEYEDYYHHTSPLENSKRRDISNSLTALSGNYYLVPCLSSDFNGHHLFSKLIHANLFDRHRSTKFFLADTAKLYGQLRMNEETVSFADDKKRAYVEKAIEKNSPQNNMDFGLWSYSDSFNQLSFASGNSLFDTCAVGLKAIIDETNPAFIPLGVTHASEEPHIEDKVLELAYGDAPIYLGANGPVFDWEK